MNHKFSVAIALLTCAVSAQGAIYQCGSTFQGHPCQGAIIRSGAPTTDNDQSGARYSQMAAQNAASTAAREHRREVRNDTQQSLHMLKRETQLANHVARNDARKLPGGMGKGAIPSVGLLNAMTGG